jgi:hypothetical protein
LLSWNVPENNKQNTAVAKEGKTTSQFSYSTATDIMKKVQVATNNVGDLLRDK